MKVLMKGVSEITLVAENDADKAVIKMWQSHWFSNEIEIKIDDITHWDNRYMDSTVDLKLSYKDEQEAEK